MAEIIGFGGIFIKFRDPQKMIKWYHTNLGIRTNDYGILFEFGPESPKGHFQVAAFPETSDYFGNEKQTCMLNFRVSNLPELINKIQSKGVVILDELATYDYGKFIHIQDPEGNSIELWEPSAENFENSSEITMPQR